MMDLPQIHDPRGDLTFVEGGNHLPFDIARVYYLYNVPVDSERGGHAHRGFGAGRFCPVRQFSDENRRWRNQVRILAARPAQGPLYQPHDLARDGCVQPRRGLAVVLASHRYDEADYYREYQDFLAAVQEVSNDPLP